VKGCLNRVWTGKNGSVGAGVAIIRENELEKGQKTPKKLRETREASTLRMRKNGIEEFEEQTKSTVEME
jgi:hypothetical protein